MLNNQLVDELKSKYKFVRLNALKAMKRKGELASQQKVGGNIQIHTSYSFSPYTPSMAAFMAHKFSLKIAGILDSYSISGAKEFISACKILDLTYSVGLELRGDFSAINTPHSNIALFGIAEKNFKTLSKYLEKFRKHQIQNVKSTIVAVNKKLEPYGITISLKDDVLPIIQNKRDKVLLSKYVYFALADKIITKFGQGEKCYEFLRTSLNMEISELDMGLLADETNPFYIYDLVNIIAENYIVFGAEKHYEQVDKIITLGHSVGAICSFEYALSKFTKKLTQNELVEYNRKLIKNLKALGFDAVSFDPSKFSETVLNDFVLQLKNNEMLMINLSRVEFPRRRFDEIKATGALRDKMIETMHVIVGSEMCENSGDEGFVNSGKLTIKTFDEKVKLFANIGNKS